MFTFFKDIVNSTNKIKLWNIKHQSRLKVLQKLYYSLECFHFSEEVSTHLS